MMNMEKPLGQITKTDFVRDLVIGEINRIDEEIRGRMEQYKRVASQLDGINQELMYREERRKALQQWLDDGGKL